MASDWFKLKFSFPRLSLTCLVWGSLLSYSSATPFTSEADSSKPTSTQIFNQDNEEEGFAEKTRPEDKVMPFKLGFEFQEVGHLCPWASQERVINETLIQNEALLYYQGNSKDNALWHVVIDGNDIEFVTRPFSDCEREQLKECITTILTSLNLMNNLLLAKKSNITFLEWKEKIAEEYGDDITEDGKIFKLLKDKSIKYNNRWKPNFQPQATIQHPLKFTIPLYFSLFGVTPVSDIVKRFIASIPEPNSFQRFEDQRLNGLLFLHAHTLVTMTPYKSKVSDNEWTSLADIKSDLEKGSQVNPKRDLCLMSRRPFSMMLCEISQGLPKSYFEIFNTSMKNNTFFADIHKIPELFYKTNYAVKFFNDNGLKKDLSKFYPSSFSSDLEGCEVLEELLKEGVVSTGMLRKLATCHKLFTTSEENYRRSIESIQSPQVRYEIDHEGEELQIREVRYNYDGLSPPWFLKTTDSMGAYKGDLNEEEKRYGEAIVEIRGISYVGECFLEKTALDKDTTMGFFLVKPNEFFISQAMGLFDFLFNFGQDDDLNDIVNKIRGAYS